MPHKRTLRELICQECGGFFIGVDFGGGNITKTCSSACLQAVRERHIKAHLGGKRGCDNARWNGGKLKWACEYCGKVFEAYRKLHVQPRRYCSWQCSNRANRKTAYGMRARLRFENQLMEFLENRGYKCLRSAGSRGPVDVFAINSDHIRAIQVKSSKQWDSSSSIGMMKKAVLELRSLPSPPHITKELWLKPLRRNWRYIVIDDLPEDPALLRSALRDAQWVEA